MRRGRAKRAIAVGALAAALALGLYAAGLALGLYGRLLGAGEPADAAVPRAAREARDRAFRRDADALAPERGADRILFGDLHVHTTFSNDAFVTTLPLLGGGGAHPVSDACDYARFCSALDFWSINDHAESLTPRTWRETVRAIRQCNAVADDPRDPDVVAFLGWEWSQVGQTPETHYGHKNVVLRDTEEGAVPARPIGAAGPAAGALRTGPAIPRLLPLLDLPNRQRYFDYLTHLDAIRDVPACPRGVDVRELPPDCYEAAATPAELFEKLAQWNLPSVVIPHGTSWGFYTPPGTTWDNQLAAGQRGDGRQTLFEVYSGHGSSEEYRDWREVRTGAEGRTVCPEPTPEHLPNCWRAGQIVAERCRAAGLAGAECEARAAEARRRHAEAGVAGHRVVSGESAADWLDAGQCRDCFLPAFDYRPGGSAQYALALRRFEDGAPAGGFRFGFLGSSDDHKARPGQGYKEIRRGPGPPHAPEGEGEAGPTWRERLLFARGDPEPRSHPVDREAMARRPIRVLHHERVSLFMTTGGLAAVHAAGRSREAIWDALSRRAVYGTSGERILLWFRLENAVAPDGEPVPMGGRARMETAPRFEVRALGALEQRPGCPDHAVRALGPERLAELCRGECHHPSDRRRPITRIEVVRIRPQVQPDEEVGDLVEDPWRVLPCDPEDASGCVVHFEDPDFATSGRDALYYVRALQAPTPAVNADPLRCERDDEGRCTEARPCPRDRDCLAPVAERAWSSPILVEHAAPARRYAAPSRR